ncbi:putative ABC transporter permease protein HI [Clostridium pasteurianum DSM 525 = ATCC 6013]|uniref:ABC-type transporter, integral membrane subunit n=1 Tax=Clostridium pasteurianum DSM 525 = ATCC 6013 TaxID=1262449 RepID=A0A0H3J868_CLOPA|nr:iron ABC transporter permease [Clostridium pasteurianum]AJA49639.1 putative ABC transporter permease protein HI [Clostridium pasteurianum DSM 525 = ATCC 6013]AJA53627.1 putative ABC transporter permease protein HI [Clostridium pasteurianum DSM 525 = ATCC 6013]AOZ76791.1 Fe3+-siderophore ABC transporter permease [Clostridium pasteurianum DSM 525 = ATCC 6013]AOZ80588.1 Fe3+-siderophore ABC transporter permease [Clostridium pasteurianum]ELP58845.1 ABC transporter permease [Clostridium pasteuri
MKIINTSKLKSSSTALISNSIANDDIKTKSHKNYLFIALILLPVFAFIISFTIGRYAISIPTLFDIFYSKLFGLKINYPDTLLTVLFKVRIPRILAAMMVGAALSVSGATYQGLFKNPMVSPDILGASAGAGFGAAIAILLSFNIIEIQICAFVFGLIAVSLTYFISSIISKEDNGVLSLVLTGMVISSLCSAFISLIKYVGDPYNKLPEITFWLMGGLSSTTTKNVLFLIIPMVFGLIPIVLLRWNLNVLSLGEEEAKSLGVSTSRVRIIMILCSTLMTSASVAIGGLIGWVGLIIPHLARMIVGPNYRILLPASIFIGSTYLLLVDDVARSLFSMEIPLGILTSLIGAPFFIYLLLRGRRGWI